MKKIIIYSRIYRWDDKVPICLQSIINQTYENWIFAILVSEDSFEPIKEYLESQMSSDLISKKVQFYFFNNFNNNKKILTTLPKLGDYFFIIDGDDYLELDCLERLFFALESTDSDIACCGVSMHHLTSEPPYINNNRTENSNILIENSNYANYFQKYFDFYRAIWGKLYKSTLFKDGLFDNVKGNYGVDTMFTLTLLSQTNKFVILDGIGYNYMVWSGSISNEFLDNREKSDVILYNFIEKFLLSYEQPLSKPNETFLAMVHNSGIIDILKVLVNSKLNINQKFDKFHYIITNEVSIKTLTLANSNVLNTIRNNFLGFLIFITDDKFKNFTKNDYYQTQIYEIFSIIYSNSDDANNTNNGIYIDNINSNDTYKKSLELTINLLSFDYIDYSIDILNKSSIKSANALNSSNFEIFIKNNNLLKLLLDDNSTILAPSLISYFKTGSLKPEMFNFIKTLFDPQSPLVLISNPNFLYKYKKLYDLLIALKLQDSYNMMKKYVYSNKKIEYFDDYINIYIHICKSLGFQDEAIECEKKLVDYLKTV